MSRRQENKARASASILEAAQALIEQHGVARTTTRQIAQHAGISYQTLYNYFPTKSHLILVLMSQDISEWRNAVDNVIKQHAGDLLGSLRRINEIGLQQFNGDAGLMWQEVVPHLFARQADPQQLESLNQIAHERYHALLSMAQGMGQLGQDVDLHLLAHTLFCLSDHAFLRLFQAHMQQPETILRTLDEQIALLLTPYLGNL
jgi:AcrR family transcriptional regulator